jgi:hypothetical protein
MFKHHAVLALLTSVALFVPAQALARPQGQGLFQHDTHECVPAVGSVDTLLTGGRSMWIGDHHYLIRSYTSDGVPGFGNGAMTGVAERGQTTCSGNLLGSDVVSVDYLVK